MSFCKYQAALLVDEHGLTELFPELDREELIDELQDAAGSFFDYGPIDFANEAKREEVVGHCVAVLIDIRREKRGDSKRWYAYQIAAEDQALTPAEEKALRKGNWMTKEDFAAEVAAFDDRRELQAKYG